MAISHHLDLYRYWLAERAGRTMPARRDLDPGDIPALLPYLMIVDKVDDRYRYRLVGTATAREIGHDPTGSLVGSYSLEGAAAAQAIYERAFASGHPVFATGEHKTNWGAIHNMSLLVLPLSDNGTNVNMAVSTLAARFNLGVTASDDWLQSQPIKLAGVRDVAGLEDLEKLCLDWERHCMIGNAAAEDPC
jgi:hypothetical protein